MKKQIVIFLSVFVVIMSSGNLNAQKSIIQEETRIIKTYPFSEPDPVPILVRNPKIYPYFAFNKYSQTGQDQEWKVVRLENDYIQVFVLPEVGGKVYGAIEKSTGQEFIYLNEVLKFRRISLRGPWTSGGVEFNFGIVGHTPATATPVDYLLRENEDGSVSCFVGNMDLPSRTRWSVEIRLPADKAFFETRALWYNASPFHQSYYSWITPAIKASQDLQYFFPGRFFVPHNPEIPLNSWPVDKAGRDLSWYKNNNFRGNKSHFILGEYKHFYGAYWHDSDFGFGHWALYDDMPGSKMWIWALSRQGGIWEDLLTDTDGQYSEPQAGRLFSQVDHELFTPYSGDSWREIWFPVKKIGGMVQASPYGVLNVQQTGDSLRVGICALQELEDEFIMTYGDKEIYRERIHLKPMAIYIKSFFLQPKTDQLWIRLGNKLAFVNDPEKYKIQRPINYHRVDASTPEGLYLAAEYHAKRREYNQALKKYQACLNQEPQHIRALTRLAELYSRRAEYEKGLQYAKRALQIEMYDADANYVYGILSRQMGNLVDAKETLGWAARSMKYRSNAYGQMAEMYVLEKNFDLALEYAQRALDYNKYNLRAYEILALIYRKREEIHLAQNVLSQLTEIDPLNHLARFEQYLLNPNQENIERFKSMIRNEFPHENFLEMAIFYYRLGLEAEAIRLLKLAPNYPPVWYWLAYLFKERDPDRAQTYLEQAAQASPKLVFPFRQESIPVFAWAMKKNPDDWKAKYYLGLICWSKGRIERAQQLFADCGEPDFAPYYLASGYLHFKSDPQKTLSFYKKARAVEPEEWRTWHYLIGQFTRMSRFVEALTVARKAVEKFPHEVVLNMDYASSLFNNGRYAESLGILDTLVVLPYEGAWEAHDLFVRNQIYLAMQNMKQGTYDRAIEYLESSKAYPEHLGTGKPFEADFRLQDYLESLCYEKMNQPEKAYNIQKRMYDYTLRNWLDWGQEHYFGAMILKHFEKTEKALELLQEWQSLAPENLNVQWYVAKFTGNEEKAREIEQTRGQAPRFKMMVEIVELIEEMKQ